MPAVLAGFVILGTAPAASELVGIALVVIASAVAVATRPRR
jgi:threonine/homoserine efflux transporter RhtA